MMALYSSPCNHTCRGMDISDQLLPLPSSLPQTFACAILFVVMPLIPNSCASRTILFFLLFSLRLARIHTSKIVPACPWG